ncbi:GTP cyclohydrolase 1 [Pseudoclavibacter endophyticus]|uniref:GTP cyclohydrolase 1 n=1 Tax=Pseudoclavibacter endophyticus TaxID=1778590 RepID=A0A6H9WID4_9MICO|nr:GTP cyclohydrolase I FolE [Pseudoclavibacter endophyticus]KAB1648267.1 GTP cyclohydrolase I FolE [Pseudoclavibacter endophyticus]GGA71174.1 GTP cyclohydrolase 1 [Pseudoclavibacter endophyticus]
MTARAPRLDRERMANAIAEFLAATGDDPRRGPLRRTPERVTEAALELLGGIGVDPVPMLTAGRIPLDDPASEAAGASDQPVLVRGAAFRSTCEHHLLPFTGTVHVAYVPSESIIGLSRIYDLVDIVSTRLTLQERIGDDLVDALMEGLDARGALAVIVATHGCVGLRGSRQERGETITVSGRGTLADPAGRAEVMALLGKGITTGGSSATPVGI